MEEPLFVAPIRFVPIMVTGVPPDVEPVTGVMLVTVGRATYVYLLAPVTAVPLGVVMLTLTGPAVPASVLPMMVVALTTVILVNAVPPMDTL